MPMGASLVAWLCQLMLEMAVSSLYRAHPGLLLAGLSPPHDLCKVCGSGPCGKISLTSADDGQTLCVLRWYKQPGLVEKCMAVVYSPVLGPASPCTLLIWTTCSGDSFAASVPETGTRFLLGARGRPCPRVCVLYYIRYLPALQLFWLDRFTGVSWGGNPPFLFHPPGAVAMAPGGSATITVMATAATTMVVTKSPGSLSTR